MENIENQSVSYLAFESTSARLERMNKRLWIAILVLIVALIGTNAGWIYYESQWQYVESTTQTITQEATSDGDSDIKMQNINGDYYGGKSETDSN